MMEKLNLVAIIFPLVLSILLYALWKKKRMFFKHLEGEHGHLHSDSFVLKKGREFIILIGLWFPLFGREENTVAEKARNQVNLLVFIFHAIVAIMLVVIWRMV